MVFIATLSACSATSSGSSTALTDSATSAVSGTDARTTDTAALEGDTGTIPFRSDAGFGPGDFVLVDPAVGLPTLAAYTATLAVSFDGTVSGTPSTWTTATTMNRRADPASAVARVTVTGDAPAQFPTFAAETDGTAYWVADSGACDAGAIDPEVSLIDMLEPASHLSGVVGGESIGTKEIDGRQADGFRFDERALARDVVGARSTGEVWVAHDDGVVLDYRISTTGGAAFFGSDTEGTLTEVYTLANVYATVALDLPDDCPPPIMNAPVPDGSTNVDRGPGMLSFDTTASISDVMAFYSDAAASIGWAPTDLSVAGADNGLAGYTFGDRHLLLLVTTTDAGSSVVISDASAGPADNGSTAGSTGGTGAGAATIEVSGGHNLSAQWAYVPEMSFASGGTLTFTDPANPLPDGSFLTLVLASGMENLSFSDGQMTIMAGTDVCTFAVDQASGFHGTVTCSGAKGLGGIGGTVDISITVDVSG